MFRISSSTPLSHRVIAYALIFAAVFSFINMVSWWGYLTYKNQMQPTFATSPDPAGVLVEKATYYRQHAGDYTALFLGDSRTLCAMHPDLIDKHWARRSYNLAHWATWMPSQYALISDTAPFIPKDTLVVWSVGHQNFSRSPIRAVYPPGWTRIIPMTMKGLDAGELLAAQLAFTPALALVGRSDEFFTQVKEQMARPLWTRTIAATSVNDAADTASPADPGTARFAAVQADPLTSFAETWPDDHGRIASIAQYKTNGAMMRTEIIPSFYRAKQKEDRDSGAASQIAGYAPDETQMALFRDILQVFKDQGLTVIVNELEETPYRYKNTAEKKNFRQWMRTHVKPVVEEYGFRYVHADESNLTDADYFDYNHMNERGVRRYNDVLGRKLKAMDR